MLLIYRLELFKIFKVIINFDISAVFSDSTISALRYYKLPGWESTAQFIAFITNMWKILNVKSASKGIFSRR